MDNEKSIITPPSYGRGADVCTPPQSWTCTITCAPGTRFPAERLFGAPGAEACVVLHCSCQDVGVPLPWTKPEQAGEIADTTLPLALVIFGIQYLVGLR